MIQIKKGMLLLVILSLPVCFIWGWLLGIDSGVDTGYKVAYLEMNNLGKHDHGGEIRLAGGNGRETSVR